MGGRAVTSEDNILEKTAKPIGNFPDEDFPLTKIKIPKIGLEQVVPKGVDVEVLKNGPVIILAPLCPGREEM